MTEAFDVKEGFERVDRESPKTSVDVFEEVSADKMCCEEGNEDKEPSSHNVTEPMQSTMVRESFEWKGLRIITVPLYFLVPKVPRSVVTSHQPLPQERPMRCLQPQTHMESSTVGGPWLKDP